MKTKPWVMLVAMLAGWINRQQQEVIEYLKAENSILKDELLRATGRKIILLNDKQRRWLGRPNVTGRYFVLKSGRKYSEGRFQSLK